MSASALSAAGAVSQPLGSWMLVPGNRRRFLEKIYEPGGQPDGVFFDLEDGVVPEAKATARENIAAVLREGKPGPLRSVRVNAVGLPIVRRAQALLAPAGRSATVADRRTRSDQEEG